MVKHTSRHSIPSIPQKRAVIWKAVSSERQAQDDKVSLSDQERLAREWCEINDYEIVKILEVPGYSRRESDIVTALEDFAEQGIYAYRDLRQMWREKAFDVLIAYSHDRLGRSNTLHSWVMENTIINGMQIYLLADGGFVGENDFRFKMAFGGMMAATPIDRLIKAAASAKDKLIMQGLPTGAQLPLSHNLVRDPGTGKAVQLVINEDLRQMFDDLAQLLIEGVAYNLLSKELFERFGHKTPGGKPYRHNQFFDLLFTPTFWGHLARRYTATSINGNLRGTWTFDESVEPPAGVMVVRNVIPAMYTGETAEAVKAELYRRMDMTGKRKPENTYRFSGLFICGECSASLCVVTKPVYGRRGVKCPRVSSRTMEGDCHQRGLVTHRYLQAEMEKLLNQLISGMTPDIYTREKQQSDTPQKVKAMQRQRDDIEQRMIVLINEQSTAPAAARAIYRGQIEGLSEKLERLNDDLLTLQRKMEEETYLNQEETRAVDELRRLTLECFWKLPDRQINQWLRRLMGKRKFVIIGKQIIDVADNPPRKRSSGPGSHSRKP